jgi:two-component system sensor histidine kinase/response regulator
MRVYNNTKWKWRIRPEIRTFVDRGALSKKMSGKAGTVEELGVETLKILVVGAASAGRVSSLLERAAHTVVTTPDLVEATEALMVSRFDAVLLTAEMPPVEIEEFTAVVRELDRRAGTQTRTPVLFIAPDGYQQDLQVFLGSGIDEIVAESIDADALSLAIARLASAVSIDKGAASAALAPELPVLNTEALREQVAYDDELLIELIDLYIGERSKQSSEMQEALASGDYNRLSRVAHTIKGSLGSLHAPAAHATANALEMAARESDVAQCQDFLAAFEKQLDAVEEQLLILRRSLTK